MERFNHPIQIDSFLKVCVNEMFGHYEHVDSFYVCVLLHSEIVFVRD